MSKEQYIQAINEHLEKCNKEATFYFILALLRKFVAVGEPE